MRCSRRECLDSFRRAIFQIFTHLCSFWDARMFRKWPAIVILLGICSPSAVSGFIVPIVVDAVQEHAFRAASHVGQEVSEISPPVAYRYPTPSPICPFFVVRIGTSLNHVCPRIVFGGSSVSWRIPMFPVLFPLKASTTFGFVFLIGSKIVREEDFLRPAVTATKPARTPFSFLVGASNNDKPAESLAASVYKSGSHDQGVYHH